MIKGMIFCRNTVTLHKMQKLSLQTESTSYFCIETKLFTYNT